jgi:hypothetical protein
MSWSLYPDRIFMMKKNQSIIRLTFLFLSHKSLYRFSNILTKLLHRFFFLPSWLELVVKQEVNEWKQRMMVLNENDKSTREKKK